MLVKVMLQLCQNSPWSVPFLNHLRLQLEYKSNSDRSSDRHFS